MDKQIPEDPYRILARERSHEDARQNRCYRQDARSKPRNN